MSETFTFTHEELEQLIEEVRKSYNVREVVCEKTGRRWPMLNWVYATGVVTIDTTEGDARLREGILGVIKNAESAISAGSEHSEAFRFMAQELRELVE
jgi:hypothetical protein